MENGVVGPATAKTNKNEPDDDDDDDTNRHNDSEFYPSSVWWRIHGVAYRLTSAPAATAATSPVLYRFISNLI